jgi:hypothetical protein
MRSLSEVDMRIPLPLLLASVILLLPLATVAEGATGCCEGRGTAGVESARAEFTRRVHAYVDLHRLLVAPLGPEEMCSDPEQLDRQSVALATAIRQARSAAQPGDIFTERVVVFLRRTIAAATRADDVLAPVEDLDEDGQPIVVQLEVNGEFPWNVAGMTPPGLLRALPAIPDEVEYRFVARDLVLLDVRADLIVDVLEDALPAQIGDGPAPHDHAAPGDTSEHPPGALQPCDVHPEMPACWM